MLNAIRYARETETPYFGICLGMQTACIEFARNVCGLHRANSSEFDPATPYRIIYKLRELTGVEEMGGTMRLGAWECVLESGSLAAEAYGMHEISERHRHRYEFNREYEPVLTGAGLRLTGTTPDATYVEIIEIPRASVLCRLPVPPRIQVQAARAAPALSRVHPRQLRAPPFAGSNRSNAGSPGGIAALHLSRASGVVLSPSRADRARSRRQRSGTRPASASRRQPLCPTPRDTADRSLT